MTNLKTNLMLAAAALVVAAGSASAQNLKAEIPFSFRASGAGLPAGTYDVLVKSSTGGTRSVQLRNVETHQSVIAVSNGSMDATSKVTKDGAPKMQFACAGSRCEFSAIWPGQGDMLRVARPTFATDADTRVAVISLVRDRAK